MTMDMDTMTLGDCMKHLEDVSAAVARVHPWDTYAIRLDGRAFSSFAKRHFGALSTVFRDMMRHTAGRLMTEFCAEAASTHSDEITLLYPALCSKAEADSLGSAAPQRMWSGRTLKTATVAASFAASVFTVCV